MRLAKDEAKGNLLYQKFNRALGFDSLRPPRAFAKPFGASPLGDSISILPVPLVISRQERETIQKGTAQQIKALSKWFADLIIGRDPEAEISNKIVPAEIVTEIMATSQLQSLERLRRFWTGKTEADITFLGAPDLIRAPDGKRYTLEFNVGPLGGLGDCPAIHDFFAKSIPPGALAGLSKDFLVTTNDFADLVKAWASTGSRRDAELTRLQRVKFKFDGKDDEREERLAKELSLDRYITALKERWIELKFTQKLDLECCRLAWYLSRLGVTTIARSSIVLGEVDTKSPIALFETDTDLPLSSFFSGAVKFLNAPGTSDVLGNKLLLPYLDDLIRHYCKEEPLLPCVPSKIVSLRGRTPRSRFSFELFPFDPNAPRLVVRPQDRIVIKLQDGSQGGEVYPFLPATYRSLSEQFELAGGDVEVGLRGSDRRAIYVAQPFIDISRLVGNLVDIRPMAVALGGGDSYVGESFWGRGIVPKEGVKSRLGDVEDSLKLNVSQKAVEVVVIGER